MRLRKKWSCWRAKAVLWYSTRHPRPAESRKKGRVVPTNSICILGGVEIEEAGGGELTVGGRPKRKEAGRLFLLQAPDRTRGAFELEIQKRVAPGAPI